MRSLFRLFTRQPLAAKVPEITVMFWVIKILTTAAGEAISDYLSTGNKEVGALVEIAVFVAALIAQFSTRRYFAPAYWFLALAIAVAGTGVSDTMHLTFGIPYAGTTLFWAVVLAAVFFLWDRSEHTLSIHSITTSRREKFYWATIFATFALGTALGGLHRDDAGARVSAVSDLLLRRHPHPVDRVVPLPPERDLRLLVRLCRHPAHRCVVRRLLQQAKGHQRSRLRRSQDGWGHHIAGRHPGRIHGRGPLRHPATPLRHRHQSRS